MESESPSLSTTTSDIPSSIRDDVDDDVDSLHEGVFRSNSTMPSLSVPLLFLFALDGMTLALPDTAFLYIINTRVAMPLHLLPTYAALAFLPCSLKPLYAHWSQQKILRSCCTVVPGTLTTAKLMSILWILAALCSLATIAIPSSTTRGILPSMVLAFLRGVCSSWPGLLMEFCLIDEVRDALFACEHTSTSLLGATHSDATGIGSVDATNTTNDNSDHNFTIDSNQNNFHSEGLSTQQQHHQVDLQTRRGVQDETWPMHMSNGETLTFHSVATVFQAQSATARNVASVLATGLNGVGLLWMGLQERFVTVVLLITALAYLLGAVVVGFSYNPQRMKSPLSSASRNEIPGEQDILIETEVNPCDSVTHQSSIEIDVARDRQSELPEDNPLLAPVTAPSNENVTTITAENDNDTITHRNFNRQNTILVILLQTLLLIVTLKSPLQQVHPSLWVVLFGVVFASFLGQTIIAVWIQSQRGTEPLPRTHRVALFLFLRQAIPDVSYLMESLTYQVFAKTIPSFFTMMSLMDMMISSLASWSYGRIFHRYPIIPALAMTTVLAAGVAWGGQLIQYNLLLPTTNDGGSEASDESAEEVSSLSSAGIGDSVTGHPLGC